MPGHDRNNKTKRDVKTIKNFCLPILFAYFLCKTNNKVLVYAASPCLWQFLRPVVPRPIICGLTKVFAVLLHVSTYHNDKNRTRETEREMRISEGENRLGLWWAGREVGGVHADSTGRQGIIWCSITLNELKRSVTWPPGGRLYSHLAKDQCSQHNVPVMWLPYEAYR